MSCCVCGRVMLVWLVHTEATWCLMFAVGQIESAVKSCLTDGHIRSFEWQTAEYFIDFDFYCLTLNVLLCWLVALYLAVCISKVYC